MLNYVESSPWWLEQLATYSAMELCACITCIICIIYINVYNLVSLNHGGVYLSIIVYIYIYQIYIYIYIYIYHPMDFICGFSMASPIQLNPPGFPRYPRSSIKQTMRTLTVHAVCSGYKITGWWF